MVLNTQFFIHCHTGSSVTSSQRDLLFLVQFHFTRCELFTVLCVICTLKVQDVISQIISHFSLKVYMVGLPLFFKGLTDFGCILKRWFHTLHFFACVCSSQNVSGFNFISLQCNGVIMQRIRND